MTEPTTAAGRAFVAFHGDLLGKAPLARLIAAIEAEERAKFAKVTPDEAAVLIAAQDRRAVAAFLDDPATRDRLTRWLEYDVSMYSVPTAADILAAIRSGTGSES